MLAEYPIADFAAGASGAMFGLIAVASVVGLSQRDAVLRALTIFLVGVMFSVTVVGVYQRFVLRTPELTAIASFETAHLGHLIGFLTGVVILIIFHKAEEF